MPTNGRGNTAFPVLHVANGEYFAGAEQVVMTIGQNVDPQRFPFALACLFDGPLAGRAREANLDVVAVPMRSKLDFSVVPKLVSLIKRKRVGLIHTHTVRSNLVGRLAGRLAGVPVVTTVHSPISQDTENEMKNRFNTVVERLTDRWVYQYIPVSHSLKTQLLASGMDSRRITVIHNGIDVSGFGPQIGAQRIRRELGIDKGVPVAGMIALFRPRKGAEVLLQAFVEVGKALPEARLVMVGDGQAAGGGNYLEDLKSLTRDLDLGEKVVFTGFRRDIPDLLAAFDVLVIPSLYGEGLPIVLLEAMAMGRAVVATPVEGVVEVVRDGQTGFLVQAGDCRKLTRALRRVLGEPAEAGRLGLAARDLAQREFSAEVMARKLESVYQNALDHHEGRR